MGADLSRAELELISAVAAAMPVSLRCMARNNFGSYVIDLVDSRTCLLSCDQPASSRLPILSTSSRTALLCQRHRLTKLLPHPYVFRASTVTRLPIVFKESAVMTVRTIVETSMDGFVGNFDCKKYYKDEQSHYNLRDGSVWKLDESYQGVKYNQEASEADRRKKITAYCPADVTIMRDKTRVFMKIQGKGVRRQVVPVHLPDPDRYLNPPPRK